MKRPVRLTVRDRGELVRVTTTGVHPVSMIMRARVLVALDTSAGEVDTTEVIAARVGVSGETLRLVAKRFAETGGGIWATIERKQRERPPVPSPVTGEVEALLIALACSQPLAGHARWSLSEEVLDHPTEVERGLRRGDGRRSRDPIPTEPGQDRRKTASTSAAPPARSSRGSSPPRGWRRVHALPQPTTTDWTEQVNELLTVDYPNAQTVVLVMDNLNTPH
jgi:hypothetical protein